MWLIRAVVCHWFHLKSMFIGYCSCTTERLKESQVVDSSSKVQGNVGLRHISICTVKLIGNPFSKNERFYINLMSFFNLKNSSRAAWNRFIAWKLSSNILKMKGWYVSYLALTVTAQNNLVLPIRSKQRKQQLSDCESLLTSININIEFAQVDLTIWGMPKFSV